MKKILFLIIFMLLLTLFSFRNEGVLYNNIVENDTITIKKDTIIIDNKLQESTHKLKKQNTKLDSLIQQVKRKKANE